MNGDRWMRPFHKPVCRRREIALARKRTDADEFCDANGRPGVWVRYIRDVAVSKR